MYSDFLFNFYKITEENGLEEGAQILTRMATNKPLFVLDSGVMADDIWKRVQRFRKCLELIEDEKIQKSLNEMIYFSAGIMPDYETTENRFDAVEKLESTIKEFKASDGDFGHRLVAIGPGGIDHDWESGDYAGREHDYFDAQTIHDERDLFALQLTLAKKLNMPFILHSRRGFSETADVLKAIKWNRGVVHGFAYNQSELEFFLNLGWYISFCGTVTYSGKKNFSDMSELVSYVPKDRLIIESDSPYYAPVPLKSVGNEPCYINYIYEYVASKRGMPRHKLSEAVEKNIQKLFDL
ncbi:MAG: TatD family hydrolase [Treponema sp.]|nr:TatD family hydrolase [Treponema sp.]